MPPPGETPPRTPWRSTGPSRATTTTPRFTCETREQADCLPACAAARYDNEGATLHPLCCCTEARLISQLRYKGFPCQWRCYSEYVTSGSFNSTRQVVQSCNHRVTASSYFRIATVRLGCMYLLQRSPGAGVFAGLEVLRLQLGLLDEGGHGRPLVIGAHVRGRRVAGVQQLQSTSHSF